MPATHADVDIMVVYSKRCSALISGVVFGSRHWSYLSSRWGRVRIVRIKRTFPSEWSSICRLMLATFLSTVIIYCLLSDRLKRVQNFSLTLHNALVIWKENFRGQYTGSSFLDSSVSIVTGSQNGRAGKWGSTPRKGRDPRPSEIV